MKKFTLLIGALIILGGSQKQIHGEPANGPVVFVAKNSEAVLGVTALGLLRLQY